VDRFRPERAEPLSPARRRACINHVRSRHNVSERRACRVLRQHRSTQRHIPQGRADEDRLVADMVELARQYAQQECHLIGSVRLEAMITIARYGGTTRPRPQRAIAMTVLFVVTIPTA